MSVYIGHSSGSKPSVAAAAAADIVEAELALGGTPGATQYYGTNASSVRGFYPLPTGGGGGGGTTNLGINLTATVVTLSSSSGTGVDIPAATITLAGAMTAADRIKLNGIAAGATSNAADSALRDRSTHTGTQLPSTITGTTTVGQALMTLANPSAVRYARINADNTVTLLDSGAFRSAIQACVEDDARLTTNLGFTRNSEEVFVTSSTGNSATILKATGLLAGVISASDQNKLNNIASFATANSSDATLLNRANHTGTQEPSTITGSTTLGRALMTLANPGAVRYARINADNTVTLLDAAAFLSAIGGGAGSPAGSSGELQVNNAGALGGVAGSSVPGGVITSSVGMALVNPITATAGVQQNSPAIRHEGQAWANGASRSVEFRSYIQAVAGTANPNWNYITESRHSGGSWVQMYRIQTGENGNIFTTGSVAASFAATFVVSLDVGGVFRAGLGVSGARVRSGDQYGWTSSPTDSQVAADLILTRRAAANLRLGAADAASPVAQTLSVQSAVAGANTAGALWTFDGSQSAGTSAGGDIRFRTSPAAAAGTALNALRETFRVRAGRGVSVSSGNFAAEQDSIGAISVLRGVTVGTTPVVLSESGPAQATLWALSTVYAVGAVVFTGSGAPLYVCTSAHTAGASTEPGVGGSWATVWSAVPTSIGMPIAVDCTVHGLLIINGVNAAGSMANFMRQVRIKNIAGTTSLGASATTVGADESGSVGNPSISANDTNDTLEISVTGVTGETWRWTATFINTRIQRYVV
jgi:hypothetical protein